MILSEINTERLLLRPAVLEDAPALFMMYSDTAAMRYLDTPPHENLAQTQQVIQDLHHAQTPGWVICWRENAQPIGVIHWFLGNPNTPGLGYVLHSDYWRRGIMTEAVSAALDFGFGKWKLPRVELWIESTNRPSRGLAEKLGFFPRGRFRQKYSHQADNHEKVVYGMHAREWRPLDVQVPENNDDIKPRFYRMQPVLSVHDVARTVAFYRDQLGFHVEMLLGDPPDYGIVSYGEWTTDGVTIQFSRVDVTTQLQPSVALYVFVASDINELYADYLNKGVPIRRKLYSYPWGMREFEVADPNGYALRFGVPG